jgi:hypothetical protein
MKAPTFELQEGWGAKEVAEAIEQELDRREIDPFGGPDRALLEACGRVVVRHIRRRWRLRPGLFGREATQWGKVLRAMGWNQGLYYEAARRGLGLRMETHLLEAMRLEPGPGLTTLVTGSKIRPPRLAGGGIDASHWRADWRPATCDRCDLSEEETSLRMGWHKRAGGGILCRWCEEGSIGAPIPPGSVVGGAVGFWCDQCASDLNRCAWRFTAKGGRLCSECKPAPQRDSCDGCGREQPLENFDGWSLCADCYKAADDPEPVLQLPLVFEVPF